MVLNELLAKINENQIKINSFGKFEDNVLKKINYKFRLDWNYYSNRMEGGTLTKQETRSVMVGNISIKDKPIKDVMEMNGHDKVVIEILGIGRGEKRISEKRIKEVHKAIMYEEDQQLAEEIGVWKSKPNEIINYKGEKIIFAQPDEVAERIHNLLSVTNGNLDAFFNDKKDKKHPLFIASDFHLDYISTHPFYDGNGRTARIFTNLILIACGLPVIIIKDEHKQIYYQYLADIQAYGGDANLFYEFIAERVIESQQLVLDAIEGKEIDEPDDIDKRIALLKKLTTDDKIKAERNRETIYQVIRDIAFPLFETIELKCKSLNDLYMDFSKAMYYTTYNTNMSNQVGGKDSNWNDLRTNWMERNLPNDGANMKSFRFEYGLTGFKKHLNAPSCVTNIEFKFERYNYSIHPFRIDNGEEIIKTYGESLSQEEKNFLISKVVGALVDDTERYAQMK